MENTNIQKIVLDSCVVIDLIEKPNFAKNLRSSLKGKSIKFVICDIVFHEVKRVRGFTMTEIIQKISKRLGRDIETSNVTSNQKSNAGKITNQFSICHQGDNQILAFCRTRNMILLTLDRMLLKTCEFLGVQAFHPKFARGI